MNNSNMNKSQSNKCKPNMLLSASSQPQYQAVISDQHNTNDENIVGAQIPSNTPCVNALLAFHQALDTQAAPLTAPSPSSGVMHTAKALKINSMAAQYSH